MTHLQQKRPGDPASDWQYRHETHREDDKIHAIEISVRYELGGLSYFTGNNQKRGVYLGITPIEIGNGCVSFVLTSGIKMCLEELKRSNPKRLAVWAERVDAKAVEIAAAAALSGVTFAIQHARTIFLPPPPVTAAAAVEVAAG